MRIIRRLWNTGDGLVEVECECGQYFFLDINNKHNNGNAKCPACPRIERIVTLPGLHFISLRYSRESQTRNWECGKCRCEFIARPEETEADIECPNCHQKREAV